VNAVLAEVLAPEPVVAIVGSCAWAGTPDQ